MAKQALAKQLSSTIGFHKAVCSEDWSVLGRHSLIRTRCLSCSFCCFSLFALLISSPRCLYPSNRTFSRSLQYCRNMIHFLPSTLPFQCVWVCDSLPYSY